MEVLPTDEIGGGYVAFSEEALDESLLGAPSMPALINNFKGTQMPTRPKPRVAWARSRRSASRTSKGQEMAKLVFEVAAGEHYLLRLSRRATAQSSLLSTRLR
jgi:magnesium chelatase family protein